MWIPDLGWWEFIVRAIVVYVFLLVLLRMTGKRQVGQLAPFDLVLLLVLSNTVQNSMNGGDNSITGGLILASALVGLNWGRGLAHLPFQDLFESLCRLTSSSPAQQSNRQGPLPEGRPAKTG